MKFQLPISHPDAFGIVVGSTKNFWPYFVEHVKINGTVKNPVDEYSREVVSSALKSDIFHGINYQVRFDTDSAIQGKFVHIQTAGHVAGTSLLYCITSKRCCIL